MPLRGAGSDGRLNFPRLNQATSSASSLCQLSESTLDWTAQKPFLILASGELGAFQTNKSGFISVESAFFTYSCPYAFLNKQREQSGNACNTP